MSGSVKRIMCLVGTRPEAIKMAPVILALRENPLVECFVVATAQHREMLDGVFESFEIVADVDLDVMKPDQSLAEVSSRLLVGIDRSILDFEPDLLVAQGDTTTVLMSSLAAFYRQVPFAHVEAGLRTGDERNPFPEEMNRILTSRMTDLHFAPTNSAQDNLLREGVNPRNIFVTGNTVIDALHTMVDRLEVSNLEPGLSPQRVLLVTIHRRENFGEPIESICDALLELHLLHADMNILFPVHPNPNVRGVIHGRLGGFERIRLCEPLEYAGFVRAMHESSVILTDSGGVQEEAPALGKPVVVARRETERPEAVDAGVVKLVGTDKDAIVSEISSLWSDADYYRSVARGVSPYGDGRAAKRIEEIILSRFDS